ncbi:alpha-(1-_3)-arabinofuranosyltransferase domain-containing protein [Nocardioides sp. Kera G14]|uniref:alpha-(1->3)-arabinofuranosyltransferase domain-containing protein n=1 Tax=Nocardioides sp. Kera G14 TaxID=2884264 RepID=UPI001D10A242|nr:alpha-(1->3)-arabinofuranosyltransferase family protein [Nocardioides sp. Kera G14]UDY22424.1 alpha-(1->3)-arabinofuranosyltransferase [Nocardioides sp. Kera G14]
MRLRLRLVASCSLLLGLAFIQSPGLLVSDTKFDLAVSPVEFLHRALHLWDDSTSFGQLQDQAYGYIWPTGPFFVVGHLVGLPGWVVQRLWYAAVLGVAFVGSSLVTRALGARRDASVLIAGFAYALSPALLTKIGPISSEAWTLAIAPWVLLPLVIGSQAGSVRRAGFWAGLAVATAGGINAAATAAVLPLGVIWLLTRGRGPRRLPLLGWWTLFTILGTAWWLLPLVLLGAYSPPFLDFIESADTTTFANNVVDALRGTTDWVAYLDSTWRGGHEMITVGFLALDSAVLVGLGLIGIVHRQQRHRLFLVVSLLCGLVLVTLGHSTGAHGWGDGSLRGLLDGALAPIRNLHKFDPIVRLPLVVGLGISVDVALRSRRRIELRLGRRAGLLAPGVGVAGLVCLAAFAAAMPAWTGRLAPLNPVQSTPAYWSQAATWVNEQHRGVALLLPGSSFGHYLWGSPDDEPMQYLDAKDWAVRNAVPLAPAGNIRMLDAVETRLAQGTPSDGLANYLRRAGVGLLVVRNDLQPSFDTPDDAYVTQALSGSPGIHLLKAFGPDVGGDPVVKSDEGRLVIDAGLARHRQALEIYAVDGAQQLVSADKAPVVIGGPEDLLDAVDAGVLTDAPAVLGSDLAASDAAVPTGPMILTDGLLDRERGFGQIHEAASAVRTPGDVRRTGNRVQDYAISGGTAWRTTAKLIGARSIAASSSASDATEYGGAEPGELPFAAIDGDPGTQWVSGTTVGVPWWRVNLGRTVSANDVSITLGLGGESSTAVRVRTAAGTGAPVRFTAGATHRVSLPNGDTTWLEIRGVEGEKLALADVSLAGVDIRRELVLPTIPSTWGAPDTILLRALHDDRTGCVTRGTRTSCVAERAHASEEPTGFERVVTLPSAALPTSYSGSLTVQARPGAALTERLQSGFLIGASASSSGVPDARASVVAALDGRPTSTWMAAVDDPSPTVDVHWLGERRITSVTAALAKLAPARKPTALQLRWPGGSVDVTLDGKGLATLPEPITTDRLQIEVTDSQDAAWTDAAGTWHKLPVGISRLRLGGLPPRSLAPSTEQKDWGCGSGPDVHVGSAVVQTRLVASADDLYAMRKVPARLCGPAALQSGANDIRVDATDTLIPLSLTVQDAGVSLVGTANESRRATTATTRTIEPSPGTVILDQQENANAGWQATQGGHRLKPIILDGWRQGWLADGSSTPVHVAFAPDSIYRWALAGGLCGLLLLFALTLWRRWGSGVLPPSSEATWPPSVVGGLGLSVIGLMGGWPAVAAAVVGIGLAVLSRRLGRDEVAWGLIAAGILAVGLAYALHPWGSFGAWAGSWAWTAYVVLWALGVMVGMVAERRPKRVNGRSTNR